ncbi:EAL domain-containing protein [Citrobacter sp. DNRA3]|uniref:EAL domain-containing protein n=1 Tax=Citrobacter sp. DNRA3 TaxID=2723054 RepID=UPI001459420E|nr:EAL domain-containing protein [Citrobacter sp. DNRA3]NMD76574.1 EAL domain-containing protein [Citrobacter sp. DNRA3]
MKIKDEYSIPQTQHQSESEPGSEQLPIRGCSENSLGRSITESPPQNFRCNIKQISFNFFFFLLYIVVDKLGCGHPNVDIYLRLYDLTLPLMTALLVLYGRKSLTVLTFLVFYSVCAHPILQSLGTVSAWCAALISSRLYFNATGKQGAASFGRSRLTLHRIGWLVCFNTLLYTLIHWWVFLQLRLLPAANAELFSVPTLINMQWMMTSCITGIPFCYLLLRGVCKPVWFVNYLKHTKMLVVSGPRKTYLFSWICLLGSIMFCLVSSKNDTLIFTNYSLLWLLPAMLWGTICIGHTLVSPVWVSILFLLSEYVDNYIPIGKSITVENYWRHLVFSSSIIFIYSLTIVIAGVFSDRMRMYIYYLKRASLSEPNTGLPNVQALKKDIIQYPDSVLCMIQCPELITLTQIHGIAFRFEFVKALAAFSRTFLEINDKIYYTPGYGLLLRINKVDFDAVNTFFKKISEFRFTWKEMEIGLNIGFSYMTCTNSVNELSSIIGRLYACTFSSLQTGKPQAFNQAIPGDNIVSHGVIRHILQKTIDRQSFILLAQPIVSTRNKPHYYEILIRIKTMNNKLFFPDSFLPLAHDAGLLAKIDMAVIEQTFRFMQLRENSQPQSQFSINLTPQSLMKTDFLELLQNLFTRYSIKPERITFEIVESDIIDSMTALKVLQRLRQSGCKIAIDDFGTGASSYSRLKNLEADILKIDGSFIRNIINDEFDHHTVKSFYEAAKLKNMEVVAEFVESEEIKQILTSLGVDWLQGYHTGKPVPVEDVVF